MYEVELKNQLPEYFRGIKEFSEIVKTEEETIKQYLIKAEATRDNFYICSADEATVEYWEKRLELQALETLALRREQVLNRLNILPPYSLGFLKDKLDFMYGKENYKIEINYPACQVKITLYTMEYGVVESLNRFLMLVMPAHMELITKQKLSCQAEGYTFVGSGAVGIETFWGTNDWEKSVTGKGMIGMGGGAAGTETVQGFSKMENLIASSFPEVSPEEI